MYSQNELLKQRVKYSQLLSSYVFVLKNGRINNVSKIIYINIILSIKGKQ